MTILIDPPAWPAYDRLWSHLVSDTSLEELHAFAASHGIPRRGFERDHYDVPADAYDRLVTAGAEPVSSREVVSRLSSAGLRKRKSGAMARRPAGIPLLRPRHLERGDLVAVVATSGVVPEDRLHAGVERIKSWGLAVRVAEHVLHRHPLVSYLAAADAERAADFTRAWMDPGVSAVWAARGGYGAQRMVDLFDWRRLAEAHPKLLIGFSDVTTLHQAVASRLGLASMHAHVVTSLGTATKESAAELRRQLMEPTSVSDLFTGHMTTPVVGGVASGILVGGNLAVLASDVGTSFSRPATRGIAVIEEIGEDAYRIDRLLTQLIRAGWFHGVAGIVIGSFAECGDPVEVETVIEERLRPLGVPTVRGFDVGHTRTSATLPLGVEATLDADGGSLVLHRAALV